MGLKEFLKPDWKKVLSTILLLIFPFAKRIFIPYAYTFNRLWESGIQILTNIIYFPFYFISLFMECKGDVCPPPNYIIIVLSMMGMIIYAYILICLIYNKIRK